MEASPFQLPLAPANTGLDPASSPIPDSRWSLPRAGYGAGMTTLPYTIAGATRGTFDGPSYMSQRFFMSR